MHTGDEPRLGRPKTTITTEIVDNCRSRRIKVGEIEEVVGFS